MFLLATCNVTNCEGNKECWDNNGQDEAECISTCDVTTCDGNTECWDNGGQTEAECRCKTGYISLQNQCKGERLYRYEYTV